MAREDQQSSKFSSWNVRGLNKLVKLKQVMSRIRQSKAQIVFLQETHLTAVDVVRVKRRWSGQVFSASLSKHPDQLTFSCYYSTYQTFSRIDYYLMSSDLNSKIESCWYDSIIISDHGSI